MMGRKKLTVSSGGKPDGVIFVTLCRAEDCWCCARALSSKAENPRRLGWCTDCFNGTGHPGTESSNTRFEVVLACKTCHVTEITYWTREELDEMLHDDDFDTCFECKGKQLLLIKRGMRVETKGWSKKPLPIAAKVVRERLAAEAKDGKGGGMPAKAD